MCRRTYLHLILGGGLHWRAHLWLLHVLLVLVGRGRRLLVIGRMAVILLGLVLLLLVLVLHAHWGRSVLMLWLEVLLLHMPIAMTMAVVWRSFGRALLFLVEVLGNGIDGAGHDCCLDETHCVVRCGGVLTERIEVDEVGADGR